jgi:hypothetical protein
VGALDAFAGTDLTEKIGEGELALVVCGSIFRVGRSCWPLFVLFSCMCLSVVCLMVAGGMSGFQHWWAAKLPNMHDVAVVLVQGVAEFGSV